MITSTKKKKSVVVVKSCGVVNCGTLLKSILAKYIKNFGGACSFLLLLRLFSEQKV